MASRRSSQEIIWEDHPSIRGMILWHISHLIKATLVVLVLVAVHLIGLISIAVPILGAIVIYGIILGWGRLIRSRTTYTLTHSELRERRGILHIQHYSAHLGNITDIVIDQSILEHFLGIGRLSVDTAGDIHRDQAFLSFWGIRRPAEVERLIYAARDGEYDHDDEDD